MTISRREPRVVVLKTEWTLAPDFTILVGVAGGEPPVDATIDGCTIFDEIRKASCDDLSDDPSMPSLDRWLLQQIRETIREAGTGDA